VTSTPDNAVDLVVAILSLDSLPPVPRAQSAAALIQPAQQILGAIRREAIYEATRTLSYRDVAEQLDVKEGTINVAVSDHNRTEKPTHQYGRFLAVARAAAELAAGTTNGASLERYTSLERSAMATPLEYGTLINEVRNWIAAVERTGQMGAAGMRQRVTYAEVPVLPWVAANQRHLNLAERSEVKRGYSATIAVQLGATELD
jgi:hypothetical protein